MKGGRERGIQQKWEMRVKRHSKREDKGGGMVKKSLRKEDGICEQSLM